MISSRELFAGLSEASPNRLSFTRRAFRMLPELDSPRILDVGCGSGGPTLELARLSNGVIIALDVDQEALDQLASQVAEAGLSYCVQVINRSMLAMDFPDASFDIIWSEGSIFVVGLEKGLRDWRRLIRSNGFLIVHEMTWLRPDPPQEIVERWQKVYPGIRTAAQVIQLIPRFGYTLVGYFLLPEDFWWHEYYEPLQARILKLQRRYATDPEALTILDRQQQEVDLYRRNARWYGSAFFVMQRGDG